MDVYKCQMQSTETMQYNRPQIVPISILWRFRITLTRHIDPRLKHLIKKNIKRFTKWQTGRNRPSGSVSQMDIKSVEIPLKRGDVVRIRPINEIKATLDSNHKLKGCGFMPEMEQYCGTVQSVYKPLERFLNECDYTVRKSKGLVLLDNLFCQGIAEAGRCDRSCFYFWRVEWLEVLRSDQ
jgi:hypothetical protein